MFGMGKIASGISKGAKNMGNAMKAPVKGSGVSTGPSTGFMGRMPGMVNSMAQQFGNPAMQQGVAGAGMGLNMIHHPIQTNMPPPMPMPMPGGPNEDMSGIVRGPTSLPFGLQHNTGITGGMQLPGMQPTGMQPQGMQGIPDLWKNYRRPQLM